MCAARYAEDEAQLLQIVEPLTKIARNLLAQANTLLEEELTTARETHGGEDAGGAVDAAYDAHFDAVQEAVMAATSPLAELGGRCPGVLVKAYIGFSE